VRRAAEYTDLGATAPLDCLPDGAVRAARARHPRGARRYEEARRAALRTAASARRRARSHVDSR